MISSSSHAIPPVFGSGLGSMYTLTGLPARGVPVVSDDGTLWRWLTLGTAAEKNVGTGAGDVAAGNHTHARIENENGSLQIQDDGSALASSAVFTNAYFQAPVNSGYFMGVPGFQFYEHGFLHYNYGVELRAGAGVLRINSYTGNTFLGGNGGEDQSVARSLVRNNLSGQSVLALDGAPSQSAPMLLLRKLSNTQASINAVSLDAVVTNATDASFSTDLVFSSAQGGAMTEAGRMRAGTFLGKGVTLFSNELTGGLSVDGTNYPAITLRTGGIVRGYAPAVTTAVGGFLTDSQLGDLIFRSENARILFGIGANPSSLVVAQEDVSVRSTNGLRVNGQLLGDAAFKTVGTGPGNVITGLDPRLSDARTPLPHTHSRIENGGDGGGGYFEISSNGNATFASGNTNFSPILQILSRTKFTQNLTLSGVNIYNIIDITGAQGQAAYAFSRQGVPTWNFGTDFAANGTNDFYIFENAAGKARFYVGSDGVTRVGASSYSLKNGLSVDDNGNTGINVPGSVGAQLHVSNRTGNQNAFLLEGAANGQSKPLFQMRQMSNTQSPRDAASFDAIVTDASDASFTANASFKTTQNNFSVERLQLGVFSILNERLVVPHFGGDAAVELKVATNQIQSALTVTRNNSEIARIGADGHIYSSQYLAAPITYPGTILMGPNGLVRWYDDGDVGKLGHGLIEGKHTLTTAGFDAIAATTVVLPRQSNTGTARNAASIDASITDSSDASFSTDLTFSSMQSGAMTEAGRMRLGYFVGKGIQNGSGLASTFTFSSIGSAQYRNPAGQLLVDIGNDGNLARRGRLTIYGLQDFNNGNWERFSIIHPGDNNDTILFLSEASGTGVKRDISINANLNVSGYRVRGAVIESFSQPGQFSEMSFGESNVAYKGQIGFFPSQLDMVFALGADRLAYSTEYMRLTFAGLLGVGTSAPLARMHVQGSASGLPVQILDGVSNQSQPLLVFRQKSNTGTITNAASFDSTVTNSSDAAFGTEAVISTRRSNSSLGLRQRARFGVTQGTSSYSLYVSDIEEGTPSGTTVAAFFEAANSTYNYSIKTGQGMISFGGDLYMNGNSLIGVGNSKFAGARGTTGNLRIADTTSYGGGLLVFEGDDRGQGANATWPFATVRGFKENSTYLNRLGALAFGTQGDSFTGDSSSNLSTVKEWFFLRSDGILELKNAVAPDSLKFADGALYAENGALKWRGGSGTITVLGPS